MERPNQFDHLFELGEIKWLLILQLLTSGITPTQIARTIGEPEKNIQRLWNQVRPKTPGGTFA